MTGARVRAILLGALGIALFLGIWQVVGVYKLAGATWPSLTSVLSTFTVPRRLDIFQRATLATLTSVAAGYVIGGLTGFALAVIAHVASPLKPGLDRLVATVHAIPAVAMAPLFILFIGIEAVPVAVATLGVFFVIYIATSSGVNAATRTHLDVFRVYGAGRLDRFWRLEFPAALPAIVSGLRLAVPAAVIGAILGEWFGAPRGLGLLVVSGLQNFDIPLLWSAVLLAIVMSLILFGVMTLLERFVYERYR